MDGFAPHALRGHGLRILEPQLPFSSRRRSRRGCSVGYEADARSPLDANEEPEECRADGDEQQDAQSECDPRGTRTETYQARENFVELVIEPLANAVSGRP